MLLIIFLSMYACGGGGGGGGGASSGVTYTGSTSQATIVQTNAVDIAKGAYTGGQTGAAAGSVGSVQEIEVNRPNYLQLAQAMEEVIRQIDVYAPPGVVELGEIVSESDSIPGNCGGNASYAIQIDDTTGIFSGNMNFDNFCSEGTIVNGAATFSGIYNIAADRFDRFALTVQSLTLTLGADSFTLNGSLSYIFQSSTSATATMDIYQSHNATGKIYWVNNYVMAISAGSGYIQFGVSGRFYDPDYGYVDISTSTSFRINSGQNWPSQGVMILTGKNGTKARLTVNSATTFVVEADADGNGSYEWNSGNLNWQ